MFMAVNVNLFCDMFNRVRPQQFSYEALKTLFEYYEELGENMEFDPVAICCEWAEVPHGSDEHLEAVEAQANIISLNNNNVLIQEY